MAFSMSRKKGLAVQSAKDLLAAIESGEDASAFFRESLEMTSLLRRRRRQPSLLGEGVHRNGL
jgi:hypothetical protein